MKIKPPQKIWLQNKKLEPSITKEKKEKKSKENYRSCQIKKCAFQNIKNVVAFKDG